MPRWGLVHQILGITRGQCPIWWVQYLYTYIFLRHLLFSHHDAGTGVETLLPVTEPSQPAPRRTVHSITWRVAREVLLGGNRSIRGSE